MNVAELVATLGFEFDEKNLNKFQDGLKTATKSLAVVGAAIGAAGAATFSFVADIAATNDELGKMSERLGIGVADLQGWQYAAELGGGSADGMASSLENLSKVTSEAARGMGAGVEVFGMLGLSAVDANGRIKDTSLMMEDVADKVSQLSTQSQKLEFISKLGLSPDLLVMLDQGSAAIRAQRIEAEQLGFALDKNATQSAAMFSDELLRVKKVLSGIFSSVATHLMPILTQMMMAFKEWFIVNKEIIKQNLKGFLDGVVAAFRGVVNIVGRVYNVIDAMVGAVGGWKNALIALGVVLTMINAKVLLMPVLLTLLGAAAFLVIEDLVTYFKGGESAIGDLIDKFPLLGKAIHGIADILKMSIGGWKLLFESGDKALKGIGILIDEYLLKPFDAFIDKVTNLAETIKGIFSGITDSVGNAFGKAKDFLGFGERQQQPQALAATNQNTINAGNVFNVEMKIEGGGGNPQVLAQSMSQELSKWFEGVTKQSQANVASPIKG